MPDASLENIATVLSLLSADRATTPREINAAMPEIPRNTIYAALRILRREGKAVADGEIADGASTRRRTYRLATGGS